MNNFLGVECERGYDLFVIWLLDLFPASFLI